LGERAIYPYTRTYRFGAEPVEREMEGLVLENDLLDLQVVPALGGRLWGTTNRLTGRPLFYVPRRVGMINFGLRGAWYTGGVEFNFPRGHTVIANETIPALLRQHPDGAASAIVGNLDLTRRVGWSVGVRLQPGCSSIYFDIFLYNRTSLPVNYAWWLNADIPPSEDLEYTNGTTEVRAHFLGRREHLGEQVSWPLHQGQDFRWYIQCKEPTSLFQLAGDERWFGYYLHDQDNGVVRIGSAADAPGLKFWNSGHAEEGYLFGKGMTCGERYSNSELQSGRPETQMDYGILPAHQSLRWTEVWRPVWGLGGLSCASEAVAIHLLPRGKGSTLRLLGDRSYPDCSVTVSAQGTDRPLTCSLVPEHPVALNLPLPADCQPLAIEVRSSGGESLFSYHRPADQARKSVLANALHLRQEPEKTPRDLTPEELTLEAERLDRLMQPLAAVELAEKALAIDPGLIAAHLFLARRDLWSGCHHDARRHCLAILWRDPGHEAAHYFLALADLWQDDPTQAEIEFEHMLGHSYLLSSAAWLELARLRLARKEWTKGLEALGHCLERDANQVTARALCVATYRHAGQLEKAHAALAAARNLAPLDPLVRAELWRLSSHAQKTGPWESAAPEPGTDLFADLRPAGDTLQDALEAACDYLACGLVEDSATILEATLASIDKPDPVGLYFLGYLKRELGDDRTASSLWKKAARHTGSYVYAFRREEAAALRAALVQQPLDSLAHALLGMLEVYHLNPERAVPELEQAIQLRPGWDQPLRLLAICQRMLGKVEAAARTFELAVEANPENPGLYTELDELLASLPGGLERRKKLWFKTPEAVLDEDHTRGRYAASLVDAGEYPKAIEVLTAHTFFPEEGSSVYRDLFARASLGLSIQAAESGDLEDALRYARQASTYPEKLGLATPFICYDAPAYVLEATLLQRRGDEADARRLLEHAAGERHRETNEADYFSGLACRFLGREEEAREKFQRLIDKSILDAAWPERDHEFGVFLAVLGKAGFDHNLLSLNSLEDLPPALQPRAALYVSLSGLLLPVHGGLINAR
jgi:tetratricopeptide (TPR) repeat protein